MRSTPKIERNPAPFDRAEYNTLKKEFNFFQKLNSFLLHQLVPRSRPQTTRRPYNRSTAAATRSMKIG